MKKLPLTYARIDLDRLKKNYAAVRNIVGDNVKIMSVVKADGYGHGADVVSKALLDAGTECLAAANVDEAINLRECVGPDIDIYILSDGDTERFREIAKHRFIPAAYDLDKIRALNDEAKRAGTTLSIHLKFDTSMGRLGFSPDETERVVAELNNLENILIDGMMSHMSSADEADSSYSDGQIKTFNDIIIHAQTLCVDPAHKHIANSAAVINLPNSHYNMVRPGIMLYGYAPSRAMSDKLELKPVMSLHSRIIQIKEHPAGKSISYSRTFTTSKKSTIAVLPIGYADGLPRLLSNKGHVLVNGKKAPIVGNITMDLTMIDITGIDSVNVGDEVTIIGEDGGNRIDAWDIASLTGTICYEILTGISQRVKRSS